MKEARDFYLVHHINSHFGDLQEDIQNLDSFESFANSQTKRRAILFDFLQIGELLNQLSKPFLESFGNEDVRKIIAIRNRIVHGYNSVRDEIFYVTLRTNLPGFIEALNLFARKRYRQILTSFLGKRIKVVVDRPIGFDHDGLVYPINYGYCNDLIALDGEFQDVYVLGEKDPGESFVGVVRAIIGREDDIEDKLVITTNGKIYSEEEIEKALYFQERFFKHSILL